MFLGHLDVAPPGRPPDRVVAHSGAVAVLHTSPHPVHNTWHRKDRFDRYRQYQIFLGVFLDPIGSLVFTFVGG